jgi:ribonuclease P protein component
VSHLNPQYCLKKKSDFNNVFKKPQRFFSAHFVFLFCPNHLGYNRLGIMVAKKKVRHATKRNLLKRWLKHCFSCTVSSVSGFDIVVIGRKQVDSVFSQGFNTVKEQWAKYVKQLS